tara:strand:- start:381 stop:929 length:549 start_codon:yes stop_codon:yes gene_type:complete
MTTKNKKLRLVLRDIVQEILQEDECQFEHLKKSNDSSSKVDAVSEINATSNIDGGAGPPKTPHAFDDADEDEHAENIKSKSEVFDFETTENEGNNTVGLHEGKSLYHIFRDHPDYTPRQKVGVAIREVNKLLNEVDKLLSVSSKFKIETSVDSNVYWKTTARYLSKIEDRLNGLSNKIKQMR